MCISDEITCLLNIYSKNTKQWMSENRTSGLANWTKICPDFRRPAFERPNLLLYNVRISDVRYEPNVGKPDIDVLFRRSKPKPVPNRFGTGLGLERLKRTSMSGFPTFGSYRTSEIRTLYSKRFGRSKAGRLKSGHIFVQFAKPDVRFSDIHCLVFLE